MGNGKNTGAIVILTILAVGGLGLSGYMFVEDQFLGGNEYVPDHEHNTDKLLAVWEELEGAGTEFNVSFYENQLTENTYYTLADDNETFILNQQGWYRFSIQTYWTGLTPSDIYYCNAFKNNLLDETIGYYSDATSSNYDLNLEYYVYSDGDDSVYFGCYSSYADFFSLANSQGYNQAMLEYLSTV